MTAGELTFLTLGLSLGIAIGVATVVLVRSGAPAPEVRLTVTPASIRPRRSLTLNEGAFAIAQHPHARHGAPDGPSLARIRVLGAAGGPDDDTAAGSPATPPAPTPPASTPPAPTPPASDDCGAVRRVADERCAVAGRARVQAVATQDALREAQRAYDEHQSRAERAAETADPRAVRTAKEDAQQAFRAARAAAATPDAVEAAARSWLSEINRINRLSRDAGATARQERDAAAAMVATIERLTLEADAARISAETADRACQVARQAASDCLERGVDQRPPAPPGPDGDDERLDAVTGPGALIDAPDPAILRMLRGDRAALGAVVSGLAGTHHEDVRHWRLLLTTLVDEILARAIEAAWLVFPLAHPFWGAFTRDQSRDIARALASLGYRFDGLGGWVDDRLPGQRDLSLAVGYAGLDPMRVRHWPTEVEMAELFRDVTVAGDEYLVRAASDLTLGELVTLLGPRADDLAGLWNDWPRVRPLLLAA